ncbi:Tn3 family transposase [Nocardia salmonicida]|uniref:Tn3 family transposase n=1 Tax=Nocardia salmonicida TaxID=53431 RepID=UPI0010423282
MAVKSSYVDTYGQSEIGFGITKLLGFDCCCGSSGSTGARCAGPRPGSTTSGRGAT